jgi:hypothetical protein
MMITIAVRVVRSGSRPRMSSRSSWPTTNSSTNGGRPPHRFELVVAALEMP